MDNICVICQESITVNDNVYMPCTHIYHKNCLKDYVLSKRMTKANIDCAICRKVYYTYGTSDYDNYISSFSDFVTLQKPKPVHYTIVNIENIQTISDQQTTEVQTSKKMINKMLCGVFILLLIVIALLIITFILLKY